jgi:4-amino-4-deoxy-L-arabinose transferase-like glycosyltransferase
MTSPSASGAETAGGIFARRALWIALVAGLLVRVAILSTTTHLGTEIVDEQHYAQLAGSILAGRGFASDSGTPTSIRPPLYPGLLAAIWSVAGEQNLQAVRIAQIALALITAILVYRLGARVYGEQAGSIAAAAVWLYPSLLFFNFLILTETLFTFLLVAFLLLTVMLIQTPRAWLAAACGVALGLGALTRSVLWPVPLLFCPLLVLLIRQRMGRRLALSFLVLAGYLAVIAPWAIRNTRLQGVVTVVDTMGGMNLRMGNYEYTPEDRMWDAVSLEGEKSWVYGLTTDPPGQPVTEGQKEKWAQSKALEYMRAHPVVTLRRSLIKFADFWGLEREFIAGIRSGMFMPPLWFQIAASLLITVAYIAIVLAGTAGLWLAPPHDWRLQVVLLLPVVIIVGIHTLVFGHSRYHLPLVPILAVYGAALATERVPSFSVAPRSVWVGAAVTVVAMFAIWVRQVAVLDLERITSLLHHAG